MNTQETTTRTVVFILTGKTFIFLICLTLFSACTTTEKKNEIPPVVVTSGVLPNAPKSIVDSIRKEFPNAVPAHLIGDSLLRYISSKYGITSNQILLGASTCVDDIIYTKNFHAHQEIKGPFHLGGLAGLPFTGISGLSAFAHHIPENGTMILLIAPHIGYTGNKGWGYVHRHGQHEPSTCCGALMGTLQKLEQGILKKTLPTAEDYQGMTISNMALRHGTEITTYRNPLVALTKITNKEAEKQILDQVQLMEMGNTRYIIVMTGVLINTDYQYTDYLWLSHFSVYDVNSKTFLEEKWN